MIKNRIKLARLAFQDLDTYHHLIPFLWKGASVIKVAVSDPSKLRNQAVFMMGTPGSGKSFVVENKFLKHMPGGKDLVNEKGILNRNEMLERFQTPLTEGERNLSNITFEKAVKIMKERGIDIELVDVDKARVPFILGHPDPKIRKPLHRSEWAEHLTSGELKIVEKMEELVFTTPKKEIPSYWRQVNPDVFKEEIPTYDNKRPSMVHNMSSDMAKSYMEAVLETGDPVVIDGTGKSVESMHEKIQAALKNGYRVSLVYVSVPLTVALIRNALRARVVDPNEVEKMSRQIPQNYNILKSQVHKARVIINRYDDKERSDWENKKHVIEKVMKNSTGMGLVEFILKHAPQEVQVLKDLKII